MLSLETMLRLEALFQCLGLEGCCLGLGLGLEGCCLGLGLGLGSYCLFNNPRHTPETDISFVR